jgi:hypothetical protein
MDGGSRNVLRAGGVGVSSLIKASPSRKVETASSVSGPPSCSSTTFLIETLLCRACLERFPLQSNRSLGDCPAPPAIDASAE